MLVIVALGGNALLRRGEPLRPASQQANIQRACRALAPIADAHSLVITHGNGPQVGLLALEHDGNGSFPLDVLSAETEGMIGYVIERELGNLLPRDRELATMLTMVEVDAGDPAFAEPSKPIGPVYDEAVARELTAAKGWPMKRELAGFRRVVASPQPLRIVEIEPIRLLLDHGCVVICAGGGGIAVVRDGLRLAGVPAVIDKDLASALLARQLGADLLVMATDVDGVHHGWGTPADRLIESTDPAALRRESFEAGSMRPKVDAACAFVEATGGRAVIGSLDDLTELVEGAAGTTIFPRVASVA